MNKKAQFVAMLSLFFILGLIAINYYLVQGTGTVVKMYYTPTFVLKNNFEIKEYLFNLNQQVKYNSFKAFKDLCKKGGFHGIECEVWGRECNPVPNLEENFKKYFIDYFLESEDYDISVEISEKKKFVISGKYKEGKKIFESFNIVTKVPVEFNYTLDYDVSIFEDLYSHCKKVLSCDKEELEKKRCKIIDKPKHKCSIEENYINMEYNLEDNGFIQPKIKFKLREAEPFEEIEG